MLLILSTSLVCTPPVALLTAYKTKSPAVTLADHVFETCRLSTSAACTFVNRRVQNSLLVWVVMCVAMVNAALSVLYCYVVCVSDVKSMRNAMLMNFVNPLKIDVCAVLV